MKRVRAEATTELWRDEALGGAELLRGQFTDFSYAPHTHDTLCLAVITGGAIRIRARGTEFVTTQGQVFAANPGELHAGWPIDAGGWSLRTLYAPADVLFEAASDGDWNPARHLKTSHIVDSELAERLLRLHRLCEAGAPRLARDEALVAVSHRLLTHHTHAGVSAEWAEGDTGAIRRAQEFLDVRLDQRVSLAELAAWAGLPPFRLLRAFTRALGMSPHVYQRNRRLQWATASIRAGHSLSEVAAATGFSDQAHFTRLFRRAMGFTPGRYQMAMKPVEGAAMCSNAPAREKSGASGLHQ